MSGMNEICELFVWMRGFNFTSLHPLRLNLTWFIIWLEDSEGGENRSRQAKMPTIPLQAFSQIINFHKKNRHVWGMQSLLSINKKYFFLSHFFSLFILHPSESYTATILLDFRLLSPRLCGIATCFGIEIILKTNWKLKFIWQQRSPYSELN